MLFAFGCSTFLGLRHLSPVVTTLVQYLHWVFSRVHCISGRGHCLNHSSHLIGDFPNLEAWTRMQFLRGLIALILLLNHFVIAAQEGQAGSSIGEATVVAIQTRGFFNASSHWCASLGHCYFGQPSQPRHWSFEANQTTSYQDEQFGFQRSMEMRPLPPVDQSYHSVLSKLRRSLDFGCRHDLHPWEGEAEGPSTHELGLGPMDGMEFHRGCEQGFFAEAEKPIPKKPQGAKRQRQIYRCRATGKQCTIVSCFAALSLCCDQFLYCYSACSTLVPGEACRSTLSQSRIDPSSAEGFPRSSWGYRQNSRTSWTRRRAQR